MNGTTIPTGRDNTYSPAETDIDIQTGRAVYVDSDRYESDEAYKARVDKYVAEGFHMITDGESSDSESDGGGSSDGGSTASDVLMPIPITYITNGKYYTSEVSFEEARQAILDGRIPILVWGESVEFETEGATNKTAAIYTPVFPDFPTDESEDYNALIPFQNVIVEDDTLFVETLTLTSDGNDFVRDYREYDLSSLLVQ